MLYHLRALVIKIEKKFNITLFIFFPLRLLLVLLEFLLLKKNNSLTKFSNYFLNSKLLNNKNLSIISGGVGNDVSFEEALVNKYNIKNLILIDPTETSKKFLSKKKFTFENKALYINNNEKKIYYHNNNLNLSLDNLFNTTTYLKINCITLNKIMEKYSISKIDVLKLDIEGVADEVIAKALNDKVNIDQICFELERPLSLLKQMNYFARYLKLIFLLKRNNYILFNCSQLKLGLRSEILALKKYE